MGDTVVCAEDLLKAFLDKTQAWVWPMSKHLDRPEARAILQADLATQRAVLLAAVRRFGTLNARLDRMKANTVSHTWGLPQETSWGMACGELMKRLLRRSNLPLSEADLACIVEAHQDFPSLTLMTYGHLAALVDQLEARYAAGRLPMSLRPGVEHLAAAFGTVSNAAETRLCARLQCLLEGKCRAAIHAGEAWADAAQADLETADAATRANWTQLLAHCQSATGSKPGGKWQKQAKQLVEHLGWEHFAEHVCRWFPLVDKPRTGPWPRPLDWRQSQRWAQDLMVESNALVLKGLVWCTALKEDAAMARCVGALTLSAYRKLPGIGPRLVALGNACVWALGQMPGHAALGQLAMLKVKVKFGTAQKALDKALATAAERLGLPRDEIEEMAVPAYGMENVGVRRESMGEVTAELRITGTHHTELRFVKRDGKVQKTPPKAIKEDFADELKELKAAAKDIQKMLPAQRDRIDALFLQQKIWPMPTWRERYLDHPAVGVIARRLIWQFSDDAHSRTGIWHDGQLVSVDAEPIAWVTDATRVELWHPIGKPMNDVLAWRSWLERHAVQQPFKQAHREVYLLTAAERNTRVYSNRYAAHLLKQHQFHALCAARGWKNRLRLMVDDIYPPTTRLLPSWNLRAEYWIEGAGDDYSPEYVTDSGAYRYLSTDQVRFYEIGATENTAHAGGGGYEVGDDEPMPVEQIPPLVFSEIMRDIDLFVGVASVGNDPNWIDAGTDQQHRTYWHSFAFGDLTASARTRKQVLERLIPRLKIADRCSFDDKFLVVRGELRTYRIHLGSGNILMAPNDQYLCIVPRPAAINAAEGKVYLPFEGDRTLSVILSKAFLLAADDQISDETILTQIRRSG